MAELLGPALQALAKKEVATKLAEAAKDSKEIVENGKLRDVLGAASELVRSFGVHVPAVNILLSYLLQSTTKDRVDAMTDLIELVQKPEVKSAMDNIGATIGLIISSVTKIATSKEGLDTLNAVLTSVNNGLNQLGATFTILDVLIKTITGGFGGLGNVLTYLADPIHQTTVFFDTIIKTLQSIDWAYMAHQIEQFFKDLFKNATSSQARQ